MKLPVIMMVSDYTDLIPAFSLFHFSFCKVEKRIKIEKSVCVCAWVDKIEKYNCFAITLSRSVQGIQYYFTDYLRSYNWISLKNT